MTSPYETSALAYLMAGWAPLWLPEEMKGPPAKGYTGFGAPDADEEIVLGDWMKPGNIGIRMPETVIGIDIDRDKETGKAIGWETLQKLTKKLGPLPITYIITNQEEIRNGFTAFFAVPKGLKFKGAAGVKIDIIQRSHRYQVAAGSVHPDGPVYAWKTMEGTALPFIPEADSFEDLPKAWLDYLTVKSTAKSTAKSTPSDTVIDMPKIDGTGLRCSGLQTVFGNLIKKLGRGDAARHDAMTSAVFTLVLSVHASGHRGLDETLEKYFAAWSSRFSEAEASGRNLRGEFESAVRSAIRKMADIEKTAVCRCGKGTAPKRDNRIRFQRDVRMFR